MNSYTTIGQPIDYGGITLKNRIFFAPTTMGLRKEEYFEKLRRIAAGGCAMIIIGDVPVSRSIFAPTLFSKKGFAYYKEMAEIVHRYDCKLCAQLHQNDTVMSGMLRYLPKILRGKCSQMELRALMNEQTGTYISGLPESKVQEITKSFGAAAQEAVSAVREQLPDIPIDYKLAVRQEHPHYGNAGVLEEEIPIFVPILQKAGVTSFHVALANHSKLENTIPPRNHPEFGQEGCFLKFCDEVRKCTQLPICGVGGLSSPAFVDEQLKSGRIDCAAMSRQLIADPDWVNKVLEGRSEEIHKCVRCNKECLGGMYQHKGVHCIYDHKGDQ